MVTTAGKGGYTVAVHNIYSTPPPQPEEHHDAIDSPKTVVQGIQNKRYEMDGLAQSNVVLTSLNSAVTAKLVKITATMNAMQAQLKTLYATSTNTTRTKSKY